MEALVPYAPLALAAVIITLAQTTVQNDRAIRARVTGNLLWKVQFFCHPLIVGSFLFATAASSLHSPAGQAWLPLLLTLFVLNWGVEPWDQPPDFIFKLCFYSHHLAPLLWSLHAASVPSFDGTMAAMLFGHCWLLHTIGYLDKLGWIDKQRWFVPYMLQGAVLQCLWVRSQPSLYTYSAGCVALQFVGRWGLYLRIEQLYGVGDAKSPHYDAFESRKQSFEAAGFVLAYGSWIAGVL